MQDYMIFGGGWSGEVEEDEDDLVVKRGVVRSVVASSRGVDVDLSLNQRYELQVYIIKNPENNLRYNVASDVPPDTEDFINAINQHNPRPVPARKVGC